MELSSGQGDSAYLGMTISAENLPSLLDSCRQNIKN
jgi:hypothetical protein